MAWTDGIICRPQKLQPALRAEGELHTDRACDGGRSSLPGRGCSSCQSNSRPENCPAEPYGARAQRLSRGDDAGTGVVGGITERGNDACGAVVSSTAPAAAGLPHHGAPRAPVPLMAELSAPLPTVELPALDHVLCRSPAAASVVSTKLRTDFPISSQCQINQSLGNEKCLQSLWIDFSLFIQMYMYYLRQ